MSIDLPAWFPRSTFGLVIASLYCVLAVIVVFMDRKESGGGGWITLHGMGAAIVTLPVTALGEWIGVKPDYRRNVDMAIAIGSCALLVYLICAGLGKLTQLLFTAGKQG